MESARFGRDFGGLEESVAVFQGRAQVVQRAPAKAAVSSQMIERVAGSDKSHSHILPKIILL